jgi:hypothetical protein
MLLRFGILRRETIIGVPKALCGIDPDNYAIERSMFSTENRGGLHFRQPGKKWRSVKSSL